MCAPTVEPSTKHVVVSGAGPAGILAAIHLLRRNNNSSGIKYHVTLIDSNQNFGLVSTEVLQKRHRSWMLGLASHGLDAIRTVPDLFEKYVHEIGVKVESTSIHLGAKEIKAEIDPTGKQGEVFTVDRNFVVAALARYLNENHAQDPNFTARYDTKIMYVDGDNHRVLIRNEDTEEYLNYDLLLGCDGIRSVVREAMIKRHRDLEFDIGDIFQVFKAVHVELPEGVDASSLHILPNLFPNFQGIGLPELGGKINIACGVPRHLFEGDGTPEELKSDDPKIVAAYVQKSLKAFTLKNYDDFARQWCSQKWNRTGQAHCNVYHSEPLSIIIMGDAAHATSPSIGMGMNTALADATALNELLDQHKDDLAAVLPAFSQERVKIGNSLTDLAMHLNCYSSRHQLIEVAHLVIRSVLNKFLPSLVTEHPQAIIGRTGVALSDVYDAAMQLGIIQKHRAVNDRIRREYFERKVGMVKPHNRKWIQVAAMTAGVAAVVAIAMGKKQA